MRNLIIISLLVITVKGFSRTPGYIYSTDYSSINQALEDLPDTGGEVYIPAGVHVISETITLGNNVTIRGAGPATVIVADKVLDKYFEKQNCFGEEPETSIAFNPQYRHGAVIKNKDPEGNKGIRIYDLTIKSKRDELKMATGILFSNSENIIIRGVSLENCGASGVCILSCNNIKISLSTIEKCNNGIYIKGSKQKAFNITVTDNTIKDNRWSGIYINKPTPHGVGGMDDGPENVTIANNHILNHMCDTAIKLHGGRYIIISNNRIDRALEAGIENNGSEDFVCANNIVTNVDDGMNLAGNGCGIYFGRQTGRANCIVNSNIVADSSVGIWSETISSGSNKPVGGVSVVGNISCGNAAYGLGGCTVLDSTWVGNIAIDNGRFEPPKGQDTAGMLFTSNCDNLNITANVVADRRQKQQQLQKSGQIIRGSSNVLNSDNIVTGGFRRDLDIYINKNIFTFDILTGTGFEPNSVSRENK